MLNIVVALPIILFFWPNVAVVIVVVVPDAAESMLIAGVESFFVASTHSLHIDLKTQSIKSLLRCAAASVSNSTRERALRQARGFVLRRDIYRSMFAVQSYERQVINRNIFVPV